MTIEATTRGLMLRDPGNPDVLHLRVIATVVAADLDPFLGGFLALDAGRFSVDGLLPSLQGGELLIGQAEFIVLRCSLATSGEELLRSIDGIKAVVARTSITGLIGLGQMMRMKPDRIEVLMDAADDRRIDKLGIMKSAAVHPAFLPVDVAIAVMKDLLCLTHGTSGMLLAAELLPGDATNQPKAETSLRLGIFHRDIEELRMVVRPSPTPESDDGVWVYAGLAQVHRGVEATTMIRVIDPMAFWDPVGFTNLA